MFTVITSTTLSCAHSSHSSSPKGGSAVSYVSSPNQNARHELRSVTEIVSKSHRHKGQTCPPEVNSCPKCRLILGSKMSNKPRKLSTVVGPRPAPPALPRAQVGCDGKDTGQRRDDTAHVRQQGEVVLVHGVHLHRGDLRDRRVSQGQLHTEGHSGRAGTGNPPAEQPGALIRVDAFPISREPQFWPSMNDRWPLTNDGSLRTFSAIQRYSQEKLVFSRAPEVGQQQ